MSYRYEEAHFFYSNMFLVDGGADQSLQVLRFKKKIEAPFGQNRPKFTKWAMRVNVARAQRCARGSIFFLDRN